MSVVRVDDVTAADVESVTAIYAHHVAHGAGTFELDPPGVEEMSDRIAAVLGAGLPFLVAREGTGVVGFAYAGPYRSRPAYRYTVEDSIYLSPAATGRGVGTVLLASLLTGCEQWGARQVVAVIGDSANAPSMRLHEKCGFTHVGMLRAVGWKHGRWLDAVVMQRALGAGDATTPAADASPRASYLACAGRWWRSRPSPRRDHSSPECRWGRVGA